jgi:predicted transcriptional regulator
MAKLLQPQEVEVYYIIPGIKREIAKCMSGRGIRQGKIANLLQIEKATVSQYLSNKRGNKVEFSEEFLEQVYDAARKIDDKMSFIKEIQRLLRIARENGTVCSVHKKVSDVPQDCSPEKINCFSSDEKEGHSCGCGSGACENEEESAGGCCGGSCGCSDKKDD